MTAANGHVAAGPVAALAPDPPPPVLSLEPPMVEGNGWNWVDRHGVDVDTLEQLLGEFVEYFNARYPWTPEQLIPPCWAQHGALVEELTTLMWTRWLAFEAPTATADAAQTWHTYYLPGFLARVNTWLGSGAAECRSGNHEPSTIPARRRPPTTPANGSRPHA